MRKLADEPRVIRVEATTYDALAAFSCGEEYKWEEHLNAAVQRLGRTGGPAGTRPYVAEDESPDAIGAFIGVASFRPWWLGETVPDVPSIDDAVCIEALGITEDYRKSLVPTDDGEVPIGAWLLDWTLEQIRSTWPGEARPLWAIVHKENERCQWMLDAQAFTPYVSEGEYDVWIRSREADSMY